MILFTDLTSGPSTGNSDNSQPGQTAGQDGVIVTVWGKYLGTSPGQILVGGQQARIYSWANADHNAGPADLFTKHKMQMVSFQIPHTVPNGATTITAVVGGVTTNSLPFTVRAGNIYFVKNGGNDSAAGTWSNPWLSLPGALLQILPGDTVYPCDGVQQTAEAGDRAALDLEYGQAGRFSSQAMPKAIVAYPGAHVLIGNTAYGSSFSNYVGSGSGNFDDTAMYWTMSKLSLTANQNAAPLGSGFRLIGSYVTAPLGDQPTGGVSGFGNDLYILGNEVTGVGYYGTSKLYHPIYVQSTESSTPPRLPTESNREIGWNYLHDNYAYDGINIYRENTYSAFMTNHRVHDNYIINQPGAAMLIGEYITGENWFYNNIVIAAGSGPEPLNGDYPQHGCIRLEAGWIPVETGLPVPTTIHFYNNSIYNCGFPAAIGYPGTSGAILYNDGQQFTLDMRNNIVVAGPNAQPYVPVDSQALPSSGVSNNLWFGVGPAPIVDLAAVNKDPLYLSPSSGDLHLQTGSPAIDAGSSVSPVPTVDFDNVPRPQNGKYDIGAYEYDFGNPPAPPPLTILSTSLPAGTVGTAYSQTLAAANGTPPYTWTVSSGSLPTGFTLNSLSGQIAGTPSAAATTNFTVQVKDSAATQATATQPLSLVVNPVAVTPPVVSSFVAAPTSISAGAQCKLAWSVSGATSLSINNGVGAVSGSGISVSPAVTTTYTLTATNAKGSTQSSAQVVVAAVTTPTPTPTPGPYFVQENAALAGAGTSSTIALPAASTKGNLLIVTVTYDNTSAQVSAITDTGGNTYAKAIAPTTWNSIYHTEVWYAKNIAAPATPITATVKLSAAASSLIQTYINEYKGLDTVSPLDQVSSGVGSTGTTPSSGAKTTTAANELIFGHGEAEGASVGGGSGFSIRSLFNGNIEEDEAATAAGSYSTSFTLSSASPYIALMATFKAAGSSTPPVNQAPVVSAGSAQTITLPATATLTGTATDDGLPNPPAKLTTTWSMVSGPGTVTFANAASLSTTASFSKSGSYVLALTASDSVLSTKATVTITVNPATAVNTAPKVSAGSAQTITLPATATLTGTATDDGLPNPPGKLTTTWSMASGPGTVTFANAESLSTTASFSVAGSYVLALTASDSVLSTKATVTITVNPATAPNKPPVVSAGQPQAVSVSGKATLTGTATDDGLPNPPGKLTTTWSMVSGPGKVTFANASSLSTTATFSTSGGYVLALTAFDGALTSKATVTIKVTP